MRLRSILGKRGLDDAQRAQLLAQAVQMHRDARPNPEVIGALVSEGITEAEARALSREAEQALDHELAATVRLPASAEMDVNYYFLLGLTPEATTDEVRAAYRRKAREVHPDRHGGEFTQLQWQELMTVVGDANRVLSDPLSRRVYDARWRGRSKAVAISARRPGEKRGDWETRFRWEVAEIGRMEERLASMLDELDRGLGTDVDLRPLTWSVQRVVEQYENALIELRTQSRGLPAALEYFSTRVRSEMQRKECLVSALRELLPAAGGPMSANDSYNVKGRIQSVVDVLSSIRQAQHNFDLGALKPFI